MPGQPTPQPTQPNNAAAVLRFKQYRARLLAKGKRREAAAVEYCIELLRKLQSPEPGGKIAPSPP